MSLFGGVASQTRSRNLVEFKAGKMDLRGNMVGVMKFLTSLLLKLFFVLGSS